MLLVCVGCSCPVYLKQVLCNALHGILPQQSTGLSLWVSLQQALQGGEGLMQPPVLLGGNLICPGGCDSGEKGEQLHRLKHGQTATEQVACGLLKLHLCKNTPNAVGFDGCYAWLSQEFVWIWNRSEVQTDLVGEAL